MARALGSSKKRWFVMAVWVALSAGGAGLLVEAATSTDPQDLYPDCPADDDMDFFGDGYCDRATLNVEECGFDGGELVLFQVPARELRYTRRRLGRLYIYMQTLADSKASSFPRRVRESGTEYTEQRCSDCSPRFPP